MVQFESPDPLRRQASLLAFALTVTTVSLLSILVLERLAYAGAFRSSSVTARVVAAQLALSAPSLINLAAVWQLRRAVNEIARGELFGLTVVRAFKRVGLLLAVGAACSILLMPAFARALGYATQRLIDADLSTLILGALGLALMFVGGLVERAASTKRELEEFF